MEAPAVEYYAGGSADSLTLNDNQAAFERLRLRPRVLIDVSRVDSSVEVWGHRESMPVMIAPTAMARLAHPDGEMAIARAAAGAGVTQVLSSLSTYSIEEVAGAGANTWFQLYVYKDRSISEHLVRRAETAGYRALVVTVDLPVPAGSWTLRSPPSTHYPLLRMRWMADVKCCSTAASAGARTSSRPSPWEPGQC
jgi:isopentenyl diphosphate isomerase/L-lactate dehydrogenase-like FMN-dependent dehydrogenase